MAAIDKDLTFEQEMNQILEKKANEGKPLIVDSSKSVKNWCYHNTKKLLKKYRSTMMGISMALDDFDDQCLGELGMRFTALSQFASEMDVDLRGTYLEGRMRSMERNRQMLLFIDKALQSMRRYADNGEEYYWLIYFKYLAPNAEKSTNDAEVVEKLRSKHFSVSTSTFYRRLNAAIHTLSDILWGYTSRDSLPLTDILHKDRLDND